MKKILYALILMMVSSTTGIAGEKYTPDWQSLSKHNAAPEWFKDAKLGIYFHWGIYSVPAFETEHYIRDMHRPGSIVGKYHMKTYGDPSTFGYHDFIPKFTAEKFNAEEWAELVANAGAKFSGPVTEHHDGFAMWDSTITPWNAVNMGPKRDILGEYSKAIRKRGIKLITTFHIGRHLGKGHIPRVEDWPSSTKDPVLKQLYYSDMTDEQIMDIWVAKVDEVITNYHPDILWFDSWLHELDDQKERTMLANFFNHAQSWNQEVVVNFKQDDLSTEVGVVDIEKGRMEDLQKLPWLTDDTIVVSGKSGGWGYTNGCRAKAIIEVLHPFIDTVSKNGVLLLNISPKADGTIPDDQRAVLSGMGAWLKTYGEAIYSTRPWLAYGGGPGSKKKEEGHYGGISGADYSWRDLRFTQKGDVVYIIQLGSAPSGKTHLINEFLKEERQVESVKLINSTKPVVWDMTDKGLNITCPAGQPDKLANVYKVTLKHK